MAKFTIDMPEDMQDQLLKIGADIFGEVAMKMASKAVPIIAESVKKNLKPHYKSGELEKSIKTAVYKYNNGVVRGDIYFDGKDKETKVPNSQKAMMIEYGTSNQDADPFLDKSVKEVENEVLNTMMDIFYTEVGSR